MNEFFGFLANIGIFKRKINQLLICDSTSGEPVQDA